MWPGRLLSRKRMLSSLSVRSRMWDSSEAGGSLRTTFHGRRCKCRFSQPGDSPARRSPNRVCGWTSEGQRPATLENKPSYLHFQLSPAAHKVLTSPQFISHFQRLEFMCLPTHLSSDGIPLIILFSQLEYKSPKERNMPTLFICAPASGTLQTVPHELKK